MLTHCDKHKQAIYLGTFNRDLRLMQTTSAEATANPRCQRGFSAVNHLWHRLHLQGDTLAQARTPLTDWMPLINQTRKCARIILSRRRYTNSQAFAAGTIKNVCSRCMIQAANFARFICLNR